MPYGTKIEYKGYTLKSKLEYQWALFFDALGYDWEYEPIKFRGRGCGVYTPDFRLNKYGFFVEIKPYDGARHINKFYLCKPLLFICFGAPSRHYIIIKRADNECVERNHFNEWHDAFNTVVARPSWLASLPTFEALS